MRRIGLFGGTFDPIHVGHLDVARAARRALDLDAVLFAPARTPPHRRPPLASAPHRFAMTTLAVHEDPDLFISDVDMDTDGPSYTSSTLDRLAEHGVETQSLFLVAGADAFREIESWKHYPAILDRCHFVVVSRPGSPVAALLAALPSLSGRMVNAPCDSPGRPSIFLVDAVTAPVSSTDVRARIAAGASLAGLVPDLVAQHIAKHRLYAPNPVQGLA